MKFSKMKLSKTHALSGSSSLFKTFALTLAMLVVGIGGVWGQCNAYTNNTACTTAAPTVLNASISCTPPNNNGGRRNFVVTNMDAGNTYRVSNCGSGYDTQMTIRDGSGVVQAYNDDNGPGCSGSAASIDFTPSVTGTYRIQLNRYNCSTSNQSNGTITVTLTNSTSYCTPAPSSVDNSGITNVSAGTISNATGAESGNYANYSAQSTDVAQGANLAVSITYTTGYTYVTKIWVDWNDDL